MNLSIASGWLRLILFPLNVYVVLCELLSKLFLRFRRLSASLSRSG